MNKKSNKIPFSLFLSLSLYFSNPFIQYNSLRDDKPVVEFEQDGRQLMQVTFKPKLVVFCSDVREFEELGFRIPIELRNTALHAIRFMGYARKLQQIATFHNTIGDRMIPCVRPIMLSTALKLSNLVRSESVAWNDELSVERYVSTLQIAVDNLSRDNDILTEYHEKAKTIVIVISFSLFPLNFTNTHGDPIYPSHPRALINNKFTTFVIAP